MLEMEHPEHALNGAEIDQISFDHPKDFFAEFEKILEGRPQSTIAPPNREIYKVTIDPSKDELLTDFGKETLKDRYLCEGESYQDLFARVAGYYGETPAHAQRIYNYMSNQWFMPATPVLSNGGTTRGLPISCFVGSVHDSLKDIRRSWDETSVLASVGGGVGTYWGRLRSLGESIAGKGKTSGVIPFIRVVDSLTLAISQGCVDGSTEILTEKGWVRFDELGPQHGKVYQIDDSKFGSFVDVEEYHKYPYTGNMHKYKNPGETVDHVVTPNHRMVYESLTKAPSATGRTRVWKSGLREKLSEDFHPNRDNRVYTTGPHVCAMGRGYDTLTPRERLLIAYQADGGTSPSGSSNGNVSGTVIYNFHFSKKRKIRRLLKILNDGEYYYTSNEGNSKDKTTTISVRFPKDDQPSKNFADWIDLPSRSCVWCAEFVKEVLKWDGHKNGNQPSGQYSSTVKENADLVNAVACMAGFKALTRTVLREAPRKPIYVTHILETRATVGGENIQKTEVPFSGDVYCVTVPSGRFLARRNGATIVTGNSLRRGSAAVYLPVWHPEIEEFVEIRRPTGGDPSRKSLNLHHGVSIPDAFMEAVEAGGDWDLKSPVTGEVIRTIKARDLWVRILTARLEQGEPYILYIDRVNEYRPQQQKLLKLEVETSNLCVAPDTLIMTKKGNVTIKSVANSYQMVWNGKKWSTAYVAKTGTNVSMTRVTFSNGKSLTVTDYHKFYIKTPDATDVMVPTKDLKIGDTLIDWVKPDGSSVTNVKVVEIERDKFITDTYCFNEPEEHKGIFNDILTGNCSEITLPTGEDQFGRNRTAVCCLSSLNLETWNEWKDVPHFIDDVMLFLDNVLQDFIDRAPLDIKDAVYSAMRERSVGLGVMGFASLLQKRNVPFGSALAKSLNRNIFKHIRTQADAASVKWARIRGACPDAKDVGIEARWSNKMAVAPTATISIICGNTSPGIEPYNANIFSQKTLSGSFTVRNKHLEKTLDAMDKNTPEVWSSIIKNRGSVSHLDFLDEHTKDVFKTAFEIDPRWYIEHASDRAPFVCQAVSNNLFLPANLHKRDLHMIHFMAWKKGLKSLYYCRSLSISRAENTSGGIEKVDLGTLDNGKPLKNTPEVVDYDECLACQ